MKNLLLFLLFYGAITTYAQRTPYNLEEIFSKKVLPETPNHDLFDAMQNDTSVKSAVFIMDGKTKGVFARGVKDTIIYLDKIGDAGLMSIWTIKNRSSFESFFLDSAGLITKKSTMYFDSLKSEWGETGMQCYIVDEYPSATKDGKYEWVLRSGDKAIAWQRRVDGYLKKF